MNDQMLLLKTMLVSASNINIIKHSDDKKKRGLAWGNLIGFSFLYLLLGAYVAATCAGMAIFGMAEAVPAVPAIVIAAVSLIFTLLKAHGMLFGYKEYDMLMSMPFKTKAVVSNRFLFMYINSLPWTVIVSVAALIGYAIGVRPGAVTYVLWIVLSFFLPIIPMIIAVGVSALIAALGAGFKHKNLVLTILTFVFVIPIFFLRFFIEDMIENDKVEEVLNKSADIFSGIGKFIPTAKWFSDAINKNSVSSILLLVGISILAYEILFMIFAKFYKGINSKLSATYSVHEKVKDKDFKARSQIKSIAFKEFKRFTGSVAYSTNVGMGAVMTAIFGLIIPFIDVNSLITSMAGTPVDIKAFSPVLIVPVFIYFFTGMVSSTACSMSLEGKNYWIIKSLPFDMMSVFKGKMLFNILLFLPVSLFAFLMSCISLKASVFELAAGLLFVISTTLFSTIYGMRCGAKHMQLDWDNEIQVIKQGRAVTAYLLPNMFGTMFIGGGLVALGIIFKVLPLVMVIMAAFYLLLALLSWNGVKKLSVKI